AHAVAALLGQGHGVRVRARRPDRVPVALAPLVSEAVDVVAGDMTDAASVARALAGCDAVLHAAAEIGVSGGTGPTGNANLEGVRHGVGQAVEAGRDRIMYPGLVAGRRTPRDSVTTFASTVAEPMAGARVDWR